MLIPYNQITLTDLELQLRLGWPEEERQAIQTVLVTLTLRFAEMPAGCKTDELDGTVCYDQLSQQITQHCEKKTYKLIEHLGYDIYCIIKSIKAIDCRVTVKKKPAISNLKGIAAYTCGDWN